MKARFVRDAHGIVGALFGTKQLSFKNFLFVLAVVFFIAWLPDGIINLFVQQKTWVGMMQIGVSLGIGLWIREVINEAARKARSPLGVDTQEAKGAKGLVLFLSDKKGEEGLRNSVFEVVSNRKMPLCALWAHRESLERVLVVASEKSIKERDDFLEEVRHYMPKLVEKIVFLEEHGGDFSDAEMIYALLEKTFLKIEKEMKIRPRDVVIDVTGGSKIVSIAGAIFALPMDRQMQYVDGDGKARVYDMCYKEG